MFVFGQILEKVQIYIYIFKRPFYSSDLHSGGLHETTSVSLKTDSTHLTKQMMQMIIAHNNNVAHNHDSDNGLKMTEVLCIWHICVCVFLACNHFIY